MPPWEIEELDNDNADVSTWIEREMLVSSTQAKEFNRKRKLKKR